MRKTLAVLVTIFLLLITVAPASASIFTGTIDFDTTTIPYTIYSGTIAAGGNSGDGLTNDVYSGQGLTWYDASVIVHVPFGTLKSVGAKFWGAPIVGGSNVWHPRVEVWNQTPPTNYINGTGFVYGFQGSGPYTASSWLTFSHTLGGGGVDCDALPTGCYVRIRNYNASTSSSWTLKLDDVSLSVDATSDPFASPPAPATEYQPIIELYQVDILTPVDPDTDEIIGASRISAVPGSSLFPDAVPVYASISGSITNLVQSGGGFSVQIVNAADQLTATYGNLSRVFVEPGAEVEAGCVIGLAGPQFAAIDSTASPIFQIIFSVSDDSEGELIDWTEYDSPSGDTLCNGGDDDCINRDPHFENGDEFWTPAAGELGFQVGFGGAHATLPPGGSISQFLVLPEAGEWGITLGVVVGGLSGSNAGSYTATLGDDSISDTVTSPTDTVQLLNIGPLDPSSPTVAPDVYRLRITNSESYDTDTLSNPANTLRVEFVCLQEYGGGSAPPGTCYFPDSEFDSGAGWILEDAAIFPLSVFDETESILRLDENGTATTSFDLSGYADADATYRITYEYNGTVALSSGELTATFDATDPEGDYSNARTVITGATTWLSYSFNYTVPEDETYSGDFVLENTSSNSMQINIVNICLTPVAGEWPGFEGVPGTTPIVPASCAAVPTVPISTEVNSWVAWVGALIRFFWTCRVPGYVNSILAGIDGVQDWLAMLGRWFAVVFYMLWQLMWGMTQWAVYSGYNLTVGIVEELWSVSSGAISLPLDGFSFVIGLFWTLLIGLINLLWSVITALISLAWTLLLLLIPVVWNVFSALVVAFWDALTSLPLLNLFALATTVSSLLFGIITEVISLVITAFQVLATMAQIVGVFFTSIQVGFNGTSSADLGVVDCSTMLDTDPMYPFCVGIDVTEYAIDAFPAFQILGLALMGAMAYHTLRITIDWYRQAFAEAS